MSTSWGNDRFRRRVIPGQASSVAFRIAAGLPCPFLQAEAARITATILELRHSVTVLRNYTRLTRL
jgi:hypothetical protein